MKIIVGLGNPGKEYEKTAHNAGMMVVDQITNQTQNSNFQINKKLKSETVELEINNEGILLVKPQTFMNRSGEAILAILNFYKISLEDLIVVHDDSDLALGRIKIQKGGGSAGHHGIESIVKAVGENFVRVRIGVRVGGPPPSGEAGLRRAKAMDFILKPFNKEEEKVLEGVLGKVAEAILIILKEGTNKGMNKYNTN